MEKRIQLIQKRFNTETYKTRKSYLASNIKKLDEFINTTAATRRKNVKTRRNFAIEMRNKIRKEYESLESALPAPVIADSLPNFESNEETADDLRADVLQSERNPVVNFEARLATVPRVLSAPLEISAEAEVEAEGLPEEEVLEEEVLQEALELEAPAQLALSEEPDIPILESSTKYKYDPEFGNQVSDRKQLILTLRKALKELEREERLQAEKGKYDIPKTLYDLLINYVLNADIDLSTILTIQFNGWNNTRSRTSIFEALWIIVIGLGFLDRFPIENIQLVDWRNVNKERAPEVFKSSSNASKSENIVNVLRTMPFGTRAGGVSDITFYYSEKRMDKDEPLYKSGCNRDSCQERSLINKVFISSVKFFELDIKKNIDKFDISPLIVASDILTKQGQAYEILLFVKDNKAVSNIVEQARKRYLANKVNTTNIFGEDTLIAALNSIRSKILSSNYGDISTAVQSLYGIDEEPKSFLQLRFHQELIVEKTYNYVTTTKDTKKTVLIGVLPRGGKTYICGGIVSRLKPNTVLVLTHVPKETNKQFLNDLFMKFADFSQYNVKYLKDDEANEDYIPGKKYIIFTSYQLLKTGYSSQRDGREIRRKLLKAIVDKALIPDLCFLDEAHFGSGGNEAKEIYNTFDIRTVRVLMTATYRKPYYMFHIQPHQLFHWDYEDIQLGKRLNNGDVFNAFRSKHLLEDENPELDNTIFDRVLESQRLNGNNIEQIQKVYSKFPDIETIDSQFEEKAKEAFVAQLLDDSSKGFSMEAILAINSKQDIPSNITNAYILFNNPGLVGKFLNYIMPRSGPYLNGLSIDNTTTSVPHIEGDLGNHFNIMDRIYSDSELAGNRLTRGVPHTQIWFIPPSNGIQKRILALASLLLQPSWFSENFCVIGVSGGESDKIAQPGEGAKPININTFIDGKCLNISCANSEDLKECIEKQERANRCGSPPKGTIILTGFMLRMGISLGCADVVMMFDDDESPDSTTQKRYRALTESEGKKKSYVVDLNPRRSIRSMYNEVEGVKVIDSGPSDKIYQTMINTFGINSDRFLFPSPGGSTIDISELITSIKKENESKAREKDIAALEKDALNLTKSFNDAEINGIMRRDFPESFISSMDIKLQKTRNPSEAATDNALGGTGRERIQVGTRELEPSEPELPIEPIVKLTPEQRFQNFKNIIETTLKGVAFSYDARTSNDVYELIKNNPEVQDLVYNTLEKRGLVKEIMIKGHKRDNKGTITPPFTKYESDVYNRLNIEQQSMVITDILKTLEQISEKKTNYVYRGMKAKADDKSLDQQKILKYIDDNLSPTPELKDRYGEVFTPMRLVNEMLDNLEKAEPTIFQDKYKKWLDPANGIGNFPVAVFYRLMTQLKGVSADPQIRAEYIVRNMLYMVELQRENSLKCKRIFKKLAPDAEPNILTKNTLTEFLVKGSNGKYIASFGEEGPIIFDVIMGNPPFNPPKGETGSAGGVLWPNFVMKSYSLLKDGGHLLFVHPPGWKKPSDELFKVEKFANGDYTGQIRQGQVWQVLKNKGIFKFIYTNDQKDKAKKKVGSEYLEYFPSVDYYIYQKNGEKSSCDTKNIFLGEIMLSKGLRLNYNLKYLPNLITKESQDILYKITSKEGTKPNFSADRKLAFGKTLFGEESKGKYKYIYSANKKGPIYAYSNTKIDNVDQDKVIMNCDGGFDGYFVEFIDSDRQIGSAHMTIYSKVDSAKEGKHIEIFFKSDIVKFIFLITQYASGQRTKNEPLVANSLTIPPNDVSDYYKFFGIEEYKIYIENILAHYEKFKAPKREGTRKTIIKAETPKSRYTHKTRKLRRR